jgi:hypothetical protein
VIITQPKLTLHGEIMVVRMNVYPLPRMPDGWPASPYISLLAEHSCHPLANGPLVAGMQWERLIVRRRPRPGGYKQAPRPLEGDDDLAAAVALQQISNPWVTSLSGKVLSMTGLTLPASMSSPKTSRSCSLSAPVGQLECPARPGRLHAAIATDGTLRAVNCRSARGRSWHSRIAAMESGCLSLLTICTVHITYADRKETVQSER